MCQGSIRPSGLVKSTNEGSINKEDCAYKPFLNHSCAILIVIAHKTLIVETLCATTNCTSHASMNPAALYTVDLMLYVNALTQRPFRSSPLTRGVCLANRPRPIAGLAGLISPAGQRGPLGADRIICLKAIYTQLWT